MRTTLVGDDPKGLLDRLALGRLPLLHAMVLSMFVESVSFGPARVGRLLAAIALISLAGAFLSGWRPARVATTAWLPGFAFFTWAWASGFWSDAPSAWQAAMGALGLAVAYYAAFAFLPASRAEIRALLKTFLLAALCVSALAGQQFTLDRRAVGLQGDPNIFALYQGAAIAVAIMLARSARGSAARAAWLLAVLPLVASVIAAQSRGGLLVILVVLGYSILSGDLVRSRAKRLLLAVAVATTVTVLVPALGEQVAPRLSVSAAEESRGSGRLDIWRAAFYSWQGDPFLGLGAGGFQAESRQLLQTTSGIELSPGSEQLITGIKVHNVYLETLTEYGPVGLGLWLVVLGTTVLGLKRVAGPRDDYCGAVLPMLLATAAGTVFISATNSKLLWLAVGCYASLERLSTLGRRTHEPDDLETVVDSPQTPAETSRAGRRLRFVLDSGRHRRDVLRLLCALLPLAFGLIAAGVTSTQSTQYRSSVVLLVPPGTSRADNEAVVRTVQALVTTPPLGQDIAVRAELDLTFAEVLNRLSVERPPDSSLLLITVSDTDISNSRRIAAAVTPALSARLTGIQQAGPVEGVDLRGLTVVPVTNEGQLQSVSPPVARNTVIGAVLGALVAIAVVAVTGGQRSESAATTGLSDSEGRTERTRVADEPVMTHEAGPTDHPGPPEHSNLPERASLTERPGLTSGSGSPAISRLRASSATLPDRSAATERGARGAAGGVNRASAGRADPAEAAERGQARAGPA